MTLASAARAMAWTSGRAVHSIRASGREFVRGNLGNKWLESDSETTQVAGAKAAAKWNFRLINWTQTVGVGLRPPFYAPSLPSGTVRVPIPTKAKAVSEIKPKLFRACHRRTTVFMVGRIDERHRTRAG